jgi:hypothetical protein
MNDEDEATLHYGQQCNEHSHQLQVKHQINALEGVPQCTLIKKIRTCI